MPIDDGSPSPELAALRLELITLGFEEGMDFAITGWRTPVSSEVYVLTLHHGQYIVEYHDMGRTREVARTGSFDEVRQQLVDKLERLAGPRGRGPSAGLPSDVVPMNWTLQEQIEEARRLGLDLG